jgi:hypothetical protein
VLTDPKPQPVTEPVGRSHIRRLWHESRRNTPTLGCHICPDRALCGGLQVRAALMDCTRFCCGYPAECDQVCRKNPVGFVERVREVNGFDLNTIPPTMKLSPPTLPASLPVVFHGKRRSIPITTEAVALPLYAMLNRRTGDPRFWSGSALRAEFLIAPEPMILLTGTDQGPAARTLMGPRRAGPANGHPGTDLRWRRPRDGSQLQLDLEPPSLG